MDKAKEALAFAIAALIIMVVISVAIWTIGWAWNGIGGWWHNITTPTPAHQCR